MVVTDIRISKYDGNTRRYLYFNTTKELQQYFNKNYKFINNCDLGDIGVISDFKVKSNLYNFKTIYNVIDVCEDYTIYKGKDFDNQRKDKRNQNLSIQYTKLVDNINKYKKHCENIKKIYTNGIYSPCYAEAGWSEGTGELKYYKDTLLNFSNTNIFE
jgi:hypothetical protein